MITTYANQDIIETLYIEFIPSCFQKLNSSFIESLLGVMQALWILLFDSQLVLRFPFS